MSYNNESYNNESYNNEMSDENENANVNIHTVEEEDQEFELPPPPPLQRMNCAFVDFTIDEQGRNVFYFTQENEESEQVSERLSITVLNRQTNGPHPDCDMVFDAVEDPLEDDQERDFELPPTHPLELGFFNFVDNSTYSTFYNNMYNIIQPGIICYTEDEDEENKIQEIAHLDELVMPTQCQVCSRFDCNC